MTNPRHDLFGPVHKGLRHLMASTLSLFGTLDIDDAAALAQARAQLDELIDSLLHHVKLEDRFVLPALEACRVGSTAVLRTDHDHETRALVALRARSRELAGAADAHALYLELSTLIADTLHHMTREETEHNPLLWARYSDAELQAVQAAQIAIEQPHELARGVRWLLPAMSPRERAALVLGARQVIAPPVFEGLIALSRSVLPAAEWTKLATALAS